MATQIIPKQVQEHYLGYTSKGVKSRLEEHLNGTGAKICKAAVAQGAELILVKIWRQGTRSLERSLKKRHNHKFLCPLCLEQLQTQRKPKKVCMRKERLPTITELESTIYYAHRHSLELYDDEYAWFLIVDPELPLAKFAWCCIHAPAQAKDFIIKGAVRCYPRLGLIPGSQQPSANLTLR